jgi:flap endonuclease-1
MVIKNLNKVLKKEAPNSISKIEFKDLKNKIIAIDTSIFMYKFSYFSPNFMKLFWFQVKRFVENDIIPVYVFDGGAPEEKSDTISDRKEKKEQLESKITELKNNIDIFTKKKEELKAKMNSKNQDKILKEIDEIDNNLAEAKIEYKLKEKTNIRITIKKVKHLKKMLKEMNVPYITSITEAEKLAAHLYKKNIVDAVMTDDTDILPQGVRHVYRDYSINNYYITEVKLDVILESMGLTYEQFVDYCILCGCDYSNTLPKIGMVIGLGLIKKCLNIEGILKEKDMVCPADFKFKEARKLFTDVSDIEESVKMTNKINKLINNIQTPNINMDIDIKKYYDEFPV